MTDGGGGRTTADQAEDSPGFHFDLGGALARLGNRVPEPEQAPVEREAPRVELEQPRVEPVERVEPLQPLEPLGSIELSIPLPTRDPLPAREPAPAPELAPEPPLEPLPRRGERPPDPPAAAPPVPTHDPAPSPYVTARRSVFDDVAEPVGTSTAPPPVIPTAHGAPGAPTLPPNLVSPAAPPPAPAAAAPVLPSGGTPVLPTLPAPAPVAVPSYTPPVDSAPPTVDMNALRSAQLRASRQQRNGKLFGRTLLALLVIGGLVAAGFVFGRRYLFPTEWDAALTPLVDDIQTERGVEFEHTVGLVEQPADEYALTVGGLAFDDAWLDAVPMWRALGIANGEPTIDSIGSAVAAQRVAVYDADADRIYLSADADREAAIADLRVALEQAYAAQRGSDAAEPESETTGFVGVSSPERIADMAVGTFLAQRISPPSDAVGAAPAEGTAAPVLPLPIEYELKAVDIIGEGLLSASGVDPATVSFGAGYPATVGAALDDAPQATASGALQVGDRSLAAPVALGVDDWSLVWGARLPESTVDRLTSMVIADSYRPIDRAGVICVVGVFETRSAADAANVLSALQSWVAAAPPASQAMASAAGQTRVQLRSCDPGADSATAPAPGAVDALINRQLVRLAG